MARFNLEKKLKKTNKCTDQHQDVFLLLSRVPSDCLSSGSIFTYLLLARIPSGLGTESEF